MEAKICVVNWRYGQREWEKVVCYRERNETCGHRSVVSLPASLLGMACGFPRNTCWCWKAIIMLWGDFGGDILHDSLKM